MNYSNRVLTAVVTILIMVMAVQPLSYVLAAEEEALLININKEVPTVVYTGQAPAEFDSRIFEIGYDFTVSYDYTPDGIDIVLSLDRSNSMLRPDDSNSSLPIAQSVRSAVEGFVTDLYDVYPNSNVAITSFGTNSNKSDNWKRYNELQDVLDEIVDIYAYIDLYESSTVPNNYKAYFNNGYQYAWENWQISDGATDLSKAFEYAATTVTQKNIKEPNDENAIVLFSDGVATRGGSNSQRNINDPTTYNSNVVAGIEAAAEAQEVAQVFTVGYFDGLYADNENTTTGETTKDIAIRSMDDSDNSGFYEAATTEDLKDIFMAVITELNYIGTDAKVVEVVEDEFEIKDRSIFPEGYTLTTTTEGKTMITWKLDTVIVNDYNFGYHVKVKNHIYPTGSGDVTIPINENALLIYTSLEGVEVTENLGHLETIIPPLANQPVVDVEVLYENDQYEFLIGDVINIRHNMSFANEYPFDYRSILVGNLVKTLGSGLADIDFSLSTAAQALGWTQGEGLMTFPIQDSQTAEGSENLTWSQSVDIEVIPMTEGTYQLGYDVDYLLTNSAGLVFDFTNPGEDLSAVSVKDGKVIVNIVDEDGVSVTKTDIYINDVYTSHEVIDGKIVVANLPSDSYDVSFMIPSGYYVDSGNTEVSWSTQTISFTGDLNYDNPEIEKNVYLTGLDIRDIAVTDRDGNDVTAIDEVMEETDAMVTFVLAEPLVMIGLNLFDDYLPSDHIFTLDQVGGNGHVIGPIDPVTSNSPKVENFVMNGNELYYSGDVLEPGMYKAYGVISPPNGLGADLDYDYVESVNLLTTQRSGGVEETNSVTSRSLYVGLQDNDPPMITPELKPDNSTTNLANFDVNIIDKVDIVDFKVYQGTLTLEEVLAGVAEVEDEEGNLVIEVITEIVPKEIEDNDTVVDLNIDMELAIDFVDDKYLVTGYVTVYAKDAFGNEGIEVIEIDNEDINDLLDDNIK